VARLDLASAYEVGVGQVGGPGIEPAHGRAEMPLGFWDPTVQDPMDPRFA
jgi:hypothetical protein